MLFQRVSGEITLIALARSIYVSALANIDIFAISLSQACTLFQFQFSYGKKGMPNYWLLANQSHLGPYTTQLNNGTALVDIMNKAADENTQGPFNRWASTYFAGLGHSITSIDGVEQVWAYMQ